MSVVQYGKIHALTNSLEPSEAADNIAPAHAPNLGTKHVLAAPLQARWCQKPFLAANSLSTFSKCLTALCRAIDSAGWKR